MTRNTSAVAVCCSKASRVSVNQPRVLHRDHRLRREILQQRDLLVGKRPHLLAKDGEGAEQGVVLAQRHCRGAVRAAEIYNCSTQRITRPVSLFCRHIDMDRHALTPQHAPEAGLTVKRSQRFAQELGKRRRHPTQGGGFEANAVVGPKHAKSGFAQPHRLFEHRVEDRREVAGRRVDHLQYLGGRGLLLQGLARLGQEPRVLHRDHRLRREVFQQRDLLFGERL